MRKPKNQPETRPAGSAIRCAIYTRKSTEEGLEQEFNSLDAQRESAEAFIKSQAHEGWICLPDRYDDGGFTGGNLDRPAVRRMMADIEAGKVDCVVVYKVDRLSRSLLDFSRMMESFDKKQVSFVSVTQQFNTTHSMGRLTLNILLSFAQFEREIISERTRDKVAAARRKGKWSGGMPLLGYDVDPKGSKLRVVEEEAQRVRAIFDLYLEHQSLLPVVEELNRRQWTNKRWKTRKGPERGGKPFSKSTLYNLLTNPTNMGQVRYKTELHNGEHQGIVEPSIWLRVQTILRRNGRGGGMVRNEFGAILKGLIRCACCDCAMTPSHTKKGNKRYRYYTCLNAQKMGWQSCPSKSVPAGEVEKFIVERIRSIGRDPGLVRETLAATRHESDERLEALESERNALERERVRWQAELRETAGLGHERLATNRLADLNERLQRNDIRYRQIQEELEDLQKRQIDDSTIRKAMAAFDPVWEALTSNEQGRLLRLLIERIDYDGQKSTIALTFHPTGIHSLANTEETKR